MHMGLGWFPRERSWSNPQATRGYLADYDGCQFLLEQMGVPPTASPLAMVRELPFHLVLQAQSFPRDEAVRLEAAIEAVWKKPKSEELARSPVHTLLANMFPPLLARAVGAVVRRLLRQSTCPCGKSGCGERGTPDARAAAEAFARAYQANRRDGA